jgi:DNA polymerase-1
LQLDTQNDAIPTAYLIDASIYIFRAWFSVPDSMRGENGMPINAVYGFVRFLTEFVERSRATHVMVAFDESLTQSFRNDLYPAYKMNRELPPQALSKQFKLCRRVAEAAGLYCASHDRYEADDLIASAAQEARQHGYRNIIVTADKDLTQVLQGRDLWWDFARNKQLDSKKVEDKFGVPPSAIQDYLGLCGDAVDNIPGVAGVGPKTAVALLREFGTVEQLYANLSKVAGLKIRGAKTLADKLDSQQQQALMSKQLATVAYDAPINKGIDSLRRRAAEVNVLKDISHILGDRAGGLFQRLVTASNLASAAT